MFSARGDVAPRAPRPFDPDWLLVAGAVDVARFPGRRLILVEHGAGQAYPGDPRSAGHPSYSGGRGHEAVRLFVCPSETVAARWREAYPDARTAVVGCPALDRYHAGGVLPSGGASTGSASHDGAGPVVALAFHWNCGLIPETTSAWPFFAGRPLQALRAAADAARVQLRATAHPRLLGEIRAECGKAGIPVVTRDVVLREAGVLVVDNSSIGPEAASVGVPLVWFDSPRYRADVEHGGRFYDWVQGQVRVSDVGQVVEAALRALDDPPDVAAARERMVRSVYAYADGHAAERAAAAIVEVVGG